MDRPLQMPSWPVATYRLQLHAKFGLRQATELVDYLEQLGITHVYASPILTARPGSTHGYDVIHHDQINPELGTAQDFDDLVRALHARGMGLILDIVPNHMGVGGKENAWWLARLSQLLAIEPRFRVSAFASWYPLRRRADLDRFADGLRLAGIPDDARERLALAERRLHGQLEELGGVGAVRGPQRGRA